VYLLSECLPIMAHTGHTRDTAPHATRPPSRATRRATNPGKRRSPVGAIVAHGASPDIAASATER
jgi:hypothetical protein